MGIQGWLLLALSLLVVAEFIVLAALSSGQLLCQEDDSIVVDAQEPRPTHSWGESKVRTRKSRQRPILPTGSHPGPQHPCETPQLPLKERCLSRACPRASCTFSIRILHAPGERAGPELSGWCSMGHLPSLSMLLPNSPSKLSASTLNPSSLLISKRRCGPARLGAWFSLSSGDGGSSSELEASPGPKEQIRVGEDHPSWFPSALPSCPRISTVAGSEGLPPAIFAQ